MTSDNFRSALKAFTQRRPFQRFVVELVTEFKYVGIWFTSIHANDLAKHYTIKASKARVTSNVIFALNHRIGSLPVREGLQLYMARVDCYLISGCELAIDTYAPLLVSLDRRFINS